MTHAMKLMQVAMPGNFHCFHDEAHVRLKFIPGIGIFMGLVEIEAVTGQIPKGKK